MVITKAAIKTKLDMSPARLWIASNLRPVGEQVWIGAIIRGEEDFIFLYSPHAAQKFWFNAYCLSEMFRLN